MKLRGGINLADLDAYLDSTLNTTPRKSFPFSMYYSEGVKYHHNRQYDKTLKNYETALKIEPTSVKTLLKRSKAYLELQDYSKASEDAIAAIELISSSSFSEAHDLKGKCEYFTGDFERGFLTYFRARKSCCRNDKLRLGQQFCEEAMKNAMLKKSVAKIDGQDIKLLSNKQGDDVSKIRNKFADDKKVLELLLSDNDMKSVHSICQDGLKLIRTSEKFWTMQKPFQNRNKAIPQRGQTVNKMSLIQHVKSAKLRCQYYLRKEMASNCISECKILLQFIESHEMELDNGPEYKADVLHILGYAYEIQMKDKFSLNCFEEELKVAHYHDLVQPEIRALHHLGDRYLRKGKLRKACHYLFAISEALNCKRTKSFLNEVQSAYVSKGLTNEVNDKFDEVQRARNWARNFKLKLRTIIQDAIISPAEYLVLDVYEEEMRTMDFDIILRHLYDSGSDNIENYLKMNYSIEERNDI